jgi:hypothetical protein
MLVYSSLWTNSDDDLQSRFRPASESSSSSAAMDRPTTTGGVAGDFNYRLAYAAGIRAVSTHPAPDDRVAGIEAPQFLRNVFDPEFERFVSKEHQHESVHNQQHPPHHRRPKSGHSLTDVYRPFVSAGNIKAQAASLAIQDQENQLLRQHRINSSNSSGATTTTSVHPPLPHMSNPLYKNPHSDRAVVDKISRSAQAQLHIPFSPDVPPPSALQQVPLSVSHARVASFSNEPHTTKCKCGRGLQPTGQPNNTRLRRLVSLFVLFFCVVTRLYPMHAM